MHLINLTEAFSFDSNTQHQATSEIFLNLNKCLKSYENNKQNLLIELKAHQHIIEEIFPGKSAEIIEKTESLIKPIQTVSSITQSIPQVVKDVFFEIIEERTLMFRYFFNL